MELHNPYGEISFAEIEVLVRSSFQTTHPGDLEAQTRTSPRQERKGWGQVLLTLICQACLWFQMRLPLIYFLRVSRIIKKSGISMADYSQLKQSSTDQDMLDICKTLSVIALPNIQHAHSMRRFRKKWKEFVEQCVKEWKNLNIVSALLLR